MDNIRQLIDAGNLIEAERALINAQTQHPDSPELLNLQARLSLKLGSDLWEKGEVDRALDYLTKAMELNPTDRDIVLKCGEVLTSLEQGEPARALYASYLEKNPADDEIAKALKSLTLSGTAGKTETPHVSEKIVLAVNLVPFKDPGQLERQKNCIQSISELIPLGIIPLNICYADELMHPDGWEVFPVLSRSADKELKVDGKRKPFVTDLFDAAAEWAKKHNTQWFIVSNSDIIFTPEFLQEVNNLLTLGYETAAFSRHDIIAIDQSTGTTKGYVESRGSDVFLCQTLWWENNRNRFQPYIFGERAWDNSFAGSMATHSRFYVSFKEGLCFHLKHPETWISGPYANYNMSLFNGIDKKYGHTFLTFLDEALKLPKDKLTVEKTADLIKKYFRPDEAGPKSLKQQAEGLTSVIILSTGQTGDLSKCTDSIRKHTPEPHEVILVPIELHMNSGSFRQSIKDEQYIVVEDKHSLTYPEAFNKGIAEAKGEYVVIVNDDVVVTGGWLSCMLEHLKSASDAGIIAAMTVNVDGPQGVHKVESEELRVKSEEKASTPEYPRSLPETDGKLEQFARAFRERNRHRRIEMINLNGYCMLFRRDLVKKVGFMDERLEIPDFADNDYCLRAAIEGYRNYIAGDVFVHTYRNRTLAGRGGAFGTKLIRISKLFFEKWNGLETKTYLGLKMFILNTLSTARIMMHKGLKNEALQVLSEIMKLPFDDKKTYYALSDLFVQNRKFRDAFEILENMPESMRQDAERFSLMGYCKFFQKEIEEAAEYSEKALSLNGSSPKALNLKGMVAAGKGSQQEAEKFFRKAIESDAGWGQPYMNLGALRWDAGDREEAFTFFERAFILSPDDGDILRKYHDAAVSLNRQRQAEGVIEDAITLHPSHKELKYSLADILLKQEKTQEAMNVVEDALLHCGIDNDMLSFALKVREKIGPREINKKSGESVKGEIGTSEKEQSTTISLCMIVKNEENNIGKCLHSIQPVVDEMIVVDTGSSDRTKDIARAFGARIFDFPWTNDFSEARNFSLSKATGDWILILDADEVISPKDHEALKRLTTSLSLPLIQGGKGGRVAYAFISRNYVSNASLGWFPNDGIYLEEEAGSGWILSGKVRLFPNDPLIKFANPVHELVERSLERAGIRIEKTSIPVHHYGKLDKEKTEGKKSDYYELGKIKLDHIKGGDAHALYELAAQTMALGRHEEALGYWKKLTEINPAFEKGFIGLGTIYCDLGRYEEAVSLMRKTVQRMPYSPDVIVFYAICEMCVGNSNAAIAALEGMLRRDPLHPIAIALLATAYFCSNRKKEGFSRAKMLQNTHIDAAGFFDGFAKKLMEAQQYEYVITLLEAVIEGKYVTGETHKLLEEAREKAKIAKESSLLIADSTYKAKEKTQKAQETQQTQETTISLCMIVKDEGDNISRCLSSVKGLTDEMIVVDTGSTDRTKKIAKKLGAKVYDFKWNDNFSDARNFSLSKAKGKWILVLDADEVISPSDYNRIKELILNSSLILHPSTAYSFTTRNYVNDINTTHWVANNGEYKEEAGTGWYPGYRVRLFPNKPGIGFEHPVHERIEPSLAGSGITIEFYDIPIHHYGALDKERQSARAEQYYLLAKKKLAAQKAPDVMALHEIAVQAAHLGKYEEALTYLEDAITVKPDFAKGYLSIGNNYFNLGKYSDALESYEKAFGLDPELKDAGIQAAICRLYTWDPEPAIEKLEQIIKKEPDNIRALAVLTTLYLTTDRKTEGMRSIERLKQMHFDSADFFFPVAETMLSKGKVDHAIMLLQAIADAGIDPEKGDILLSSARMTKKLKESTSRVSLIILASENPVQTEACIGAVRRHTIEPHEVVVVPKESSPSPLSPPLKGGDVEGAPGSVASSSQSLPDSIGQSSKKEWIPRSSRGMTDNKPNDAADNLTYARVANKGLQESSGDYVVLLTDDIIVTEGWLTGMLECTMSAPDSGLAGPMMTNVEGPQGVHKVEREELRVKGEEKTAIPGYSGELPETSGKLEQFAKDFRERNRYRRIRARKLQNKCLIIKRSLIEKIGLFDEQFSTGEYAAEDYCFRAALEGLKNLIAGDVLVQHQDEKGFTGPAPIRDKILAHNKSLFADRKLFIDKWSALDIHSPLATKLFATNALTLAQDLIQKGDKQDALKALLEGLRNAPDNREIHYAVINLLNNSRNYKDALDMLEKMPGELKDDAEWFVLAGISREGMGLYEEAVRNADQALSLQNTSSKAWNLKGMIAYRKGNPEEAGKFFAGALEFDPGFAEPYANLGALQWDASRHAEALNLFEKAFILSPADENIIVNFHAVSVFLSELKRAEESFKGAASAYPFYKKIHYTLVDILLQEEKYEEAMNALEKAMLAFGIDDDILALALGIREKIGPKEINKDSSLLMADSSYKADDKFKKKVSPPPSMGREPLQSTVSLCMIVKNEEKNIARCLHSIDPLLDEMIVVDTGSSDRTKNIARAFGAKVYDFPWTGDFSEARNYSLSKATGDWLLVLDADETIAPFDQDILREILNKPANKASAAFAITSRNYVVQVSAVGWKANDGSYIREETGTGWYPSLKARIFPNNPFIRFEFPVHEFVDFTIEKLGIPVYKIDIPVHHYGKLLGEKVISKGEDYYIMGKMKLSQSGENDPVALYELAVQASELQKFDEALHYWTKLSEIKPDFSEAFFGAANSQYRLRKFEDAFNLIEKALIIEKYNPGQREVVVLYASCALHLEKGQVTIPLLERILKDDPEFPMGMFMLALAYCTINKKEDAKRYLEQLMRMRISFQDHAFDLLNSLLLDKRYSYALPILETVAEVAKSDPRFAAMLAECRKTIEDQGDRT